MTAVVCHLVADMINMSGEHLQVPVDLTYEPTDPYAVTLDFPGHADDHTGQPIRWPFARDLLACGLDLDVGRGDVRIWPTNDRVCIQLTSPDGSCTLTVPVALFVADTYRAVPRGREHVDLDAIDRVVDQWRAEISEGGAL